jgi:hypothetical protein
MRRDTPPKGSDAIPTREWVKGALFVAVMLAILTLTLFIAFGPRATS